MTDPDFNLHATHAIILIVMILNAFLLRSNSRRLARIESYIKCMTNYITGRKDNAT